MKWLVQTLDTLTSHRSGQEALIEQRNLEKLITRYKNLIPSIEITMTKTDIFSRSYTYRKEVREVCTLLHQVREQTSKVPTLDNPENLKVAVNHQEVCVNQLEQQRSNIVSMLQRGKDLLKDQHAPAFVSSEVQQLESSWNETYGQNIEILKDLKNTQKLWSGYDEQKNEILKLIAQAEDELNRLKSLSYYNASQVTADLQQQQELCSSLRKNALQMIGKLKDLYTNLANVTVPETRPKLSEEVSTIEKQFHTTLQKTEEKVTHLRQLQTKWNDFQSKINELKNWTAKTAPQLIAEINSTATSPIEIVQKTEILHKQFSEKTTILKKIKEETKYLVSDLDQKPEAKNLRANIDNLQSVINSLNQSIVHHRENANRNFEAWKEYEVGLQQLKPWIVEAEARIASLTTKPTTLPQATEMLENARVFESQCAEQIPRLENLTQVSHQIGGRSAAPDEVDTIYTRWNSVHDVATQTKSKLEKLISSWNIFESDIKKFTKWLESSEKEFTEEPNFKTQDTVKLESHLSYLKNLNNDISNKQSQFISITEASDQISHGLSLEGAINIKNRVTELKDRVSKFAEMVRQEINNVSDSLLAGQEFQMKIADFKNWMSDLKANISDISDVQITNVDTNLQTLHAYLQEHSDKKTTFNSIYEEIKYLSSKSSPEEATALDSVYKSLAQKYQALEDEILQKKKDLEKWIELSNWHQEMTAQLSHCKYEIDTQKLSVPDCERLANDLQSIKTKLVVWKEQIPIIDSALGIRMCIKKDEPLTASVLISEIEDKENSLEHDLSGNLHKLENINTKWDNFRSLQQKLTENILLNQTKLQDITYKVVGCDKLQQAHEDIADLITEHQQLVPMKENLHQDGNTLLKDDQRSLTNIQLVLSSVDSNWEKVNELLEEQRKKYMEMHGGNY